MISSPSNFVNLSFFLQLISVFPGLEELLVPNSISPFPIFHVRSSFQSISRLSQKRSWRTRHFHFPGKCSTDSALAWTVSSPMNHPRPPAAQQAMGVHRFYFSSPPSTFHFSDDRHHHRSKLSDLCRWSRWPSCSWEWHSELWSRKVIHLDFRTLIQLSTWKSRLVTHRKSRSMLTQGKC